MNEDNVTTSSDFWVGVVEDNSSDPYKNGRCRVRIIGLHSFDGTALRTEDLPYATLLTAPNVGTRTASVPNLNDWVYGTFIDGKNKQDPLILGVLPGLFNSSVYVKLTGEQQREYLKKVLAQPKAKPDVEKDPENGEPTSPALARGIVANTAIETTNNNLVAACNISAGAKLLLNKAKLETAEFIQAIRTAIVSALQSTGLVSPAIQGLKEVFSFIADTLKMINGLLEDIIEPIQKIIEAVAEVRAVIEFILGLPERLQRFLQQCLNELYAVLTQGAFEILTTAVSEATDFDTSSLPTQEALSIITETRNLIENAVTIASAPAQIADALLSPSGLTDEERKNLTKEIFPNVVEFETNIYRTI